MSREGDAVEAGHIYEYGQEGSPHVGYRVCALKRSDKPCSCIYKETNRCNGELWEAIITRKPAYRDFAYDILDRDVFCLSATFMWKDVTEEHGGREDEA